MKNKKLVSADAIKQKLVILSHQMDRDFNGLALEFAIERLVVRLQSSPKLSKHLIFKGGFVMLKTYGSNRSTIDLDTSLQILSIEEAETLARQIILTDHQDGLWMGHIESQILDHQTEYAGLRLIIRFSFGEPAIDFTRLGKIILDIGVADSLTPGPVDADLPQLLSKELISWRVYSVETIVAEKLHALVSLGSQNSRVKDIYDLSLLIPMCTDLKLLRNAIEKTFKHRSTEIPASFSDYWKKLNKSTLKRSMGAVNLANGELPTFEVLSSELQDCLLKLDDK